MTTPMIVPPPDPAGGELWSAAEGAAHRLRRDPSYVVVDLGPDGLRKASPGSDGAYYCGANHYFPETAGRVRQDIARLLAIDAAMHAPPPVDPAVDAAAHALIGYAPSGAEHVVAARLVAAVRAADGQARR